MAKRAEDEVQLAEGLDPVSRKYGELIRKIGQDLRFKRGWKANAARLLEVTPSYVSKIVSGAQFRVGPDAIERAVRSLNLDPSYFGDPRAVAIAPRAQLPPRTSPLIPLWAGIEGVATEVVEAIGRRDDEGLREAGRDLAEQILSLAVFQAAEEVQRVVNTADVETLRGLLSYLSWQVRFYTEALGVAADGKSDTSS